MKFLHRLKKEQYQVGAVAALSNAKDHLAVSKMCASNNIVGIAYSHLVIACEELCKASILRVKSLLPQVSIFDLNQYFYSHDVKHKKIWEIYSAVCQLSDSGGEKIVPTNQENAKSEDNWKVLLFIILALAIIAFTSKGKENTEMSLEEMRIRGFYVDLKDDKSWLVPNMIFSQNDFNTHLELVQTIFIEIETKLFNNDISGNELNNIAMQLGYLKTKLDVAV